MKRVSLSREASKGVLGFTAGAKPARAVRATALSAFLAAGILASPTHALDTVNLTAPGASAALLDTLRASSLLVAAHDAGRHDPVEIMASARAEYGRLINLMYEEAYYAPEIHIRVDGQEASDMSSLSVPARIGTIDIAITLGPRFNFGTVSIVPAPPGWTPPADLAAGQPARSTTLRAAVSSARDAWRAQGYAHVRVADQQIVAGHGDHQLNATVRLDPGSQLRFGSVQPQGNERTLDERIVAIAGIPEGEIHDPAALRAAEERLRTTGTFASARLRTSEQANPDGTVDVIAEVDEALPRRLGFGIEADSEAGIRLTGFWLHRNLFRGAERLRLEASIDGIAARSGGLGFTLDARYVRPATIDSDTDLEVGLRAVRVDERDYDADAIEAEAMLNRRYSQALRASAGVMLRFERATDGSGVNDFGTFGIPVSATHDTRDVPLDATRGHYLMAEIMPYVGFGRAETGIRLQFDGRAYADLGTDGRVVLAGRAQAGAIFGSSLAGTPRGYLFYSGGGGTVRGMPYQSLGVAGPPASGGLGFAAVSGELRVRVNESLTVAAFADAGRVSSGAISGTADWHAGGGFGVRYDTPVGPLRLDLATPLRRNASAAGSNALQIYLGIGQSF